MSPFFPHLTFPRPGKRAWVRVGAAATQATVYVNGEAVGSHLGAWTPFEFEITDRLRDRNELEVRCADVKHVTNGFLPTLGVRWTGARDVAVLPALNVFEGWAAFKTEFDYPGGDRILRCEAVGDYYEFFIDGERIGEAGPRDGTWDGTRDIPRDFAVSLAPGRHEIVFQIRDWRGAGGMVGPVYLATDLNERIF